jgi:hypothetical protein
MSKEKFVPVNGAYNITSDQATEFTEFLRNKIKDNNKFTSDGKPSKSGVITKTYIDGKLQQFRNRALKGDNSVNSFGFASQASKNREIAKREEAKTTTTPNTTVRKSADRYIRQNTGPGIQIDHRNTLARLLQGVKSIAKRDKISIPAANLKLASAYSESYGHSVDNLQKITDKQNNLKNVQETGLDKYYKHLADKPDRSNVDATKAWNDKRIQLSKGINPKGGALVKVTKSTSPWKAVKGFTTGAAENIQTDVKSNQGFKLSDFTYKGGSRVAGFGTV